MVGELVDQRVKKSVTGSDSSPEIAESYIDVWGRPKPIDPRTREALEKALGPARIFKVREKLEKGKCHQPALLESGGRVWGFMVQLYGVRSARNWGIGDFSDLRALMEVAAGLGAASIGVNPLHAGGVSPYSPSSRHALNTLYLDIESIPEYSRCLPARRLVLSRKFQKKIEKARAATLVDHALVAGLKFQVLELLFKTPKSQKDKKRLEEFRRNSTKDLNNFALFEALREKFGGGWQGWPEEYRDPRSKAVKAFSLKYRRKVDFHLWMQMNAREQLDAAQRRALELGMPIGLYVDLALGADAGGAEGWSDQEVFALEASCGAPPDEFNPKGQDWGLPPYSPRALKAAGYRPFVDLLRANMPEGGALRMDHVMALTRLWWVPRGSKADQGGYVHYPFEDLLAILARESRARRCMVVGEDLGTVTPEFRQALNQSGVLSYRPLLFEKLPDGSYAPPDAYPREALTCVTTHDLPTWGGFLSSSDLTLRKALGLSVDPAKEGQLREQDKKRLVERLNGEDPHVFLARTPCKVMMVQPEDVFELAEQANLPGTIDQHPNWRRKLPLPLEAWAQDERVTRLARAVAPLRGFGKRVPLATYRFQFNKDFRFRDATALVPYLAQLGVSHVYASPFLMARAGSNHGYDIVDHGRLNPEIGTEAELDALLSALRGRGMGMVLDIVPNHMGVLQCENPWWRDVLERGRASPYARYFDIDWNPARPDLRGKVLLPVLGDHYGEALEKGELKVVGNEVRYFDHRFPLSRNSLKNINTRKLAKDPLALHRLLERQHYRLAFWRVASDEINYRRFFEIADLAALRVEDPAVFKDTHALIARLCARPGVDGLRIDHPDGLADPKVYFERLQQLCGQRGGKPWVVVEKIVAGFETLPADWQVHGTTGYRFANLLTGLFISKEAEAKFTRIYERFTGERRSFDEIEHESRMLIMDTTLAAELNMLANRLARLASGNRRTQDYTMGGLKRAIAEIAACFPVYRSYVTARGASDTDRRYIDWAVGKARRASRIADPSVFDFLRSVLLLEIDPAKKERKAEMVEFATRFQQFTAPVVAKGVEDTAFYRYHRLVALNEVGNDPRSFGFSLRAFHAASEDRAKNWPHTMIGSSTHDTKRSEDTRARLGVLSELASGWRLALRRWSMVNRSSRREIDGVPAPSRSDEYLYYQALLGIWPVTPPSAESLRELNERLKNYMLKAVKEAKVHTSWINPDTAYEEALQAFVAQSLQNPLFVKEVNDVIPRLSRIGMLVGLSQAVIKVASPGVPDYYQGTEIWDFSLVDPDNRRPVDYAFRTSFLERERNSEDLLANLADGEAKLKVIRAGLKLRKQMPELFHAPAYTPLHADAGMEENVCAFRLSSGSSSVIAVAPRLFAHMVPDDKSAPLGAAWGESRLGVPPGRYENVLTGEHHEAGEGGIRLAELLRRFPVALLKN